MNLLDVLLTLMDKEELRGHSRLGAGGIGGLDNWGFVLVLLDRQIPEGDLVVGSGSCENGGVGCVPFDRGDGCGVP